MCGGKGALGLHLAGRMKSSPQSRVTTSVFLKDIPGRREGPAAWGPWVLTIAGCPRPLLCGLSEVIDLLWAPVSSLVNRECGCPPCEVPGSLSGDAAEGQV